ncbi:MAG TPA: MFS transporter [Ktedonobacterales bacterium]|nr:MFS transporter [Ktedonobacterales bacterium]
MATGHAKPGVGPWGALRFRDFRLLWLGQLISVTGSQMRVVAVGWQVYLISHSALMLGLLGLGQALALMTSSLVAGVVADAFDRRKLLIVVQSVLATGSIVLAVSTASGWASLPLIYATTFLTGAASAFDFPTRQALIASIVPRADLPKALGLNAVLFNVASIAGPVAGGFAIGALGLAGTYSVDVASFLVVIAALVAMRPPAIPHHARPRVNFGAWLEGFGYLRARPVLLSLMALDFCANFFGSPQALLPIYARDILHIGSRGLGLLVSAGAVGAVLGALFSGRLSHVRRQGLGVLLGVTVWGGCIVLFGLANGPLLPYAPWTHIAWQAPFFVSFVALAGAGAGDLVGMVLRNTIVQLSTPDELRGRVGATNSIFIIGGPTLGQFESGVVASALSPQMSVLTGGLACLLATGIIALVVPRLRRYRLDADMPSAARTTATSTTATP